jgi:hypothetical protein
MQFARWAAMRFSALNTILVLALCCGFPAIACAARQQDEPSQTQPAAPANAQPRSEPKPDQVPPQQAPPTEAPQEQAPPAQGPQGPPAQTPASPEEAPTSPTKQGSPTAAKPKTAKKKRKSATKTQPGSQSGKVVVRNGGAKEDSLQISPGMSNEQARHQRETTIQLLATTDANLKRLAGRQLTAAQQSTLDQINSYVRQSKTASDSGDLARAQTLAFKAHLLSDELARR